VLGLLGLFTSGLGLSTSRSARTRLSRTVLSRISLGALLHTKHEIWYMFIGSPVYVIGSCHLRLRGPVIVKAGKAVSTHHSLLHSFLESAN